MRWSPAEGVEYSGIIVSEAPESAAALMARGIPVESAGEGQYVEIMEIAPGSTCTRTIGRRLTDRSGRVPRGQAVSRPSWNDLAAEPSGTVPPTTPTATLAADPYGTTPPPASTSVFTQHAQEEEPTKFNVADHFHIAKKLDKGKLVKAAVASVMTPAVMNPGFIDTASTKIIVSAAATGLQERLRQLILTRYKDFLAPDSIAKKQPTGADRIRIALVNLTGEKLHHPEYAGWGSTVNQTGASVPKILAYYALFQLHFDLQHLIETNNTKSKADLLKSAEGHWKKTSFAGRPKLDYFFDFTEASGAPLKIALKSRFVDPGEKVNLDCFAANVIENLGFEWIGSVAKQSGLHLEGFGGLWLSTSYKCGRPRIARWNASPVPMVRGCRSSNLSGHVISALSLATFYTLLAQVRLTDEVHSRLLEGWLSRGCVISGGVRPHLESLSLTRGAFKCGANVGTCAHDTMFVEHPHARFVAIMLNEALDKFPHGEMIKDLDALVQS
jgi:hypothetical protein